MTEQILMSPITPSELTRLITEGVRDEIAKMMSINKSSAVENNSEELLTTKEACQYLKCSDVKLWRLRRDGLIPFTKCGRTILITKSDLEHFIGKQKRKEALND